MGIRVERLSIEIVAVGRLDDATEIHDRHAGAEVSHDGQVVRDEQVRQLELLLEIPEQVEDLRLDRDVERRHRLVEDEQ